MQHFESLIPDARLSAPFTLMIYSHDTYGLGHLRRSLTIANALVDRFEQMSVVIVSGSALADAFDLKTGVRIIKMPNVNKNSDGSYCSSNRAHSISDTIGLRSAVILQTAKDCKPDLFLADKEPAGLHGELLPLLDYFKTTNTVCALGLRDVLDEPEALAAEWEKKEAIEAIEAYYDTLWIYGPEDFYDPLQGLPLSENALSTLCYLGFLRREYPALPRLRQRAFEAHANILVMAGGGGDGQTLMRAIINAVADDPCSPPGTFNYTVLLGPFMPAEEKEELVAQAADLPQIDVQAFDHQVERLYQDADLVIGMGGYNTFCEILSFNKRALILPRTEPRLEQWIRIKRAEELGLVQAIHPDESSNPDLMRQAILQAINAPEPAASRSFPDLDGLDRLCGQVSLLIAERELKQNVYA